jgi:uncharacterized coiled-coil protein SlyX
MTDENNLKSFKKTEEKPKKRFCLKTCLTVFLILIVIVFIGSIIYWQLTKFPKPIIPIAKSYSWGYKGQNYRLNETLYQSIENYYRKKRKGIYSGFEESSLSKYLNLPKEDKTISEVTSKIKLESSNKQLTPDQTVDLAIGMVQALPYDEARARTDLTHPRYPYETLFEGKGICSDKTLLTVAILRQLGYGTAVFMYEKDQHMAAAVQCTSADSNYNSGYCIAETTTTGHKIGIIPEIDENSLQAVQRSEIKTFESNGQGTSSIKKLTDVQIYSKTKGKTYTEVTQTLANEKEIAELSQYIETQRAVIEQDVANLDALENKMNNYKTSGDIQAYNSLVPRHNNMASDINQKIREYNVKVNRYNALIKE